MQCGETTNQTNEGTVRDIKAYLAESWFNSLHRFQYTPVRPYFSFLPVIYNGLYRFRDHLPTRSGCLKRLCQVENATEFVCKIEYISWLKFEHDTSIFVWSVVYKIDHFLN